MKEEHGVDRDTSAEGAWELTCNEEGSPINIRITLHQCDERIQGASESGRTTINGERRGDRIKLNLLLRDGEPPWELTGTVTDHEMGGEGLYRGIPITWSATRSAIRPPQPKVHTFYPSRFSARISPWEKPALHIFPGDVVRTEIPDSLGFDKGGIRRSQGLPLIGPFFVEGAMPGETLALRIRSLKINRNWAKGRDSIIAAALSAGYQKILSPSSTDMVIWNLDLEANVARPADTSGRLKNYSVPLKPSLGCIAVPNTMQEALHPRRVGPTGGNLDSTFIGEGSTVFLPITQRGALLFLGDGHAIHSEGEVTGEILETSMDIEFSVEIQRKRLRCLRAEDSTTLMAFGTGADLVRAFQRATSELALWLSEEYKLSPSELGVLFTGSLRYSVAKFYGEDTTVVAMLPKAPLVDLDR